MNSSYEIVTSLQKSLRNFDREFVKMFKDMNNFRHYIINSDVHPQDRVRIYNIIKVVSRPATLSGLHSFYLTIPLQGDPADIFDIFRIDSLPYALPNSPYFVQNQPTKNIYIAFRIGSYIFWQIVLITVEDIIICLFALL